MMGSSIPLMWLVSIYFDSHAKNIAMLLAYLFCIFIEWY